MLVDEEGRMVRANMGMCELRICELHLFLLYWLLILLIKSHFYAVIFGKVVVHSVYLFICMDQLF